MKSTIILLFVIFIDSFAQTSDSSLVQFNWKGISNYQAKLLVPKNYIEKDDYYGEGIFTTLSYKDSSCIFLHFGGNMQIPIMDDNIDVEDSIKNKKGITRKGRLSNCQLFWREDNLEESLMNIGYYNVPKDKIKQFEKALDSFEPIEK